MNHNAPAAAADDGDDDLSPIKPRCVTLVHIPSSTTCVIRVNMYTV